MNLQESLNPVTRRAIGINYVSPSTCALPSEISSGSGSGSGDDVSTIDFTETVRGSGIVLTATLDSDTTILLSWSAFEGAAFYQLYRSTTEGGVRVLIQTPIGPTSYIDTPPSPGNYFYWVTAIEPNAGETEFSNAASEIIVDPLVPPPVSGYSLWLAPEGRYYTDAAGTTLATAGQRVENWEDLSGNNNHVARNDAVTGGTFLGAPTWDAANDLNGERVLEFFADSTFPTLSGHNALITAGNVPFTGGFTVFVVGRIRNTENYGTPFGYGLDQTSLRRNDNTPRLQTFKGNSGVAITEAAGPAYDADIRMAWRYSEADQQQKLYRNNIVVGTALDAGGTPAPAIITIGCNIGGGVFFGGRIAEVIVYPSPLSDAEVTLVDAYLATKYNL